MRCKSTIIILFTAVALIAFLQLLSVSASIQITSPANGTNHTGNVLLNVSFLNGTDFGAANLNWSSINATFYAEAGGASPTTIGNASTCAQTGVANEIACWGTVTLATSIDGYYNVSVELSNMSIDASPIGANVNSTANTTEIIFDSSPPQAYAENFTSPLTGSNYSEYTNGLIIINVSVFDATFGNVSVYINITNASSGLQNLTLYGTAGQLNQYGNNWNATINTSHFPDGKYNITIWANDTLLGNLNNSAWAHTVIFDNAIPGGSMSCTPSPVEEGSTTTCSCSGTDTTTDGSGVLSSTPDSATPSTAQTGTFTTSCTIRDYAGNIYVTSTTYSVTGGISSPSSSGSSPGGGGSTATIWSTTIPYSNTELSEKGAVTRELGEKSRIKIRVGGEEHHVGVTELTSTTATIEVSSVPQVVSFIIGETKKFEVTEDGFYDLSITLNSISSNKAAVTIKPIHEEVPADELARLEAERAAAAGETPETPEEPSNAKTWIMVIIIIIIIAAAAWFFISRKRR